MILNYFARLGLIRLRKNLPLTMNEDSRLPMRVTLADIDVFGHINNGRYLTLMDFGRFDYTMRTGAWDVMKRERWMPVVGAAQIRYRRELRLGTRYELVTRLAGWDEKWFFFDQRFVVGEELHARGAVRGVFKKGRQTVPPGELLRALGLSPESPLGRDELDALFTN